MKNSWSIKADQLIVACYLVMALMYVMLAMHLPVSIYTTAGHDDAWFITQAQNISSGSWLGAYNQMTLIKGVGFPYLLVINNYLGVPITLTLALLYLVACFFVAYVFGVMGLHRFPILLLFAGLIFQPALFPMRIIRDDIYCSLLLISIAGFIYILFCGRQRLKLPLIGFSGFCLGMFWITREEGVWILPSFVLMILWYLFKRKNHDTKTSLAKFLVIYFAFSLILPIATSLTNYIFYSRFGVVDIQDSAFVSALNALNKVEVGAEISHVPVPYKKREVIYKISPAFSELKDYFEKNGRFWIAPGCNVYTNACEDYAGGWFFWALRDGVNGLGYYRNPKSAANYYERLVTEINLACQAGSLHCRANPVPYLPWLTREDIENIPQKAIEAINLTIYKFGVPLIEGPSWGPENRLQDFLNFLGNPKTIGVRNNTVLDVSGWYYTPASDWIGLQCKNNNAQKYIKVIRLDSPDVATHFKDANASRQRFSFQVDGFENCSIVFSNRMNEKISFTNILDGKDKNIYIQDKILHFDALRVVGENQESSLKWLKKKWALMQLYATVAPYIFYAGVTSFAASLLFLIFKKRPLSDVLATATFLWILYFSRILLIVLVDVSSFPAINYLYLLPAFPLWMLASVVSLFEFFDTIKSMLKKHSVRLSNVSYFVKEDKAN